MTPASPRGRIVFITHDGVVGNTRVQKQAQVASEDGWSVFVVGRTGGQHPIEWETGSVRVTLVPNRRPLATGLHLRRAAPLRAPLAYRPLWKAGYQRQLVRAREDDLAHRRAQLKTGDDAGTVLHQVRSKRLAVEQRAARVAGRWGRLRRGQTRRLQARRRSADGLVDRAAIAWWQHWSGDRAWSRLDPGLWDEELAFGPVIDALRPDVVHASGSRMLPVGARAALRASAAGRELKVVWDAEAFAAFDRPSHTDRRQHLARCLQAREYAPLADLVTTRSERLAELMLRGYGLSRPPEVIEDAPALATTTDSTRRPADVRTQCALDGSTPLLVYAGPAADHRGLDTVIDSLPALVGVHVALVVDNPESPYARRLGVRASRLGVAERVHMLPEVEHDQVVAHIVTADVGIDPSPRWPDEEIALPARFHAYANAHLPVVVSDVEATAAQVTATGQGEVFGSGDTDAFVRAIRRTLAHPQRYRQAYTRAGASVMWESQAVVLAEVLAQLAPTADGHR